MKEISLEDEKKLVNAKKADNKNELRKIIKEKLYKTTKNKNLYKVKSEAPRRFVTSKGDKNG